MNFLSPFFLIGGLAVAAPIVFHLIRRTTRHRTLFSSVMFLSPTAPRLTERSRLEHWLLLLLRCLALALLALGFARPFWRKTEPRHSSAAETRRVVVLIDVSASMRRPGLWDQAREKAEAILKSVGPADQAAVLLYSRRTKPLVSFEAWQAAAPSDRLALATTRLAAAGPGWEEARLGEALIAAAEALAETAAEPSQAGPRQLYLVSDLKVGSRIDSLAAFDWPKGVELRIEPVKAAHPTNAGLQLIARSPDADRQAAPEVRVRVSNAADSVREQFQVGWARAEGAGFRGAPVDIYVPPGQSRVVALPFPASGSSGKIILSGDDADFDNTLYVAPLQQQHWNALYFGGEGADDIHAPRFFLQRALPDNPHLKVTLVAHSPATPVAPGEFSAATMCFATEALTDSTANALRAQMLGGKTVLFAPRSAATAATLARLLALPSVELEEAHVGDYAMLGSIDFQSPLFAPFADPHYSDFTKIHVWQYRRLSLAGIPRAHVIARFDRGDPAVVEVPVGAGRLLLWLTGWNPSDSQIAVSSKFVPMIAAVLDYAGGATDQTTQYTVGDVVGEDRLRQGFGGLRPGLFGGIAVNLAPSESRTAPMALDELERYGAPGPKRPADPVRRRSDEALLQASEAESRQKLWRWLLGATLLVLLAESALAGRTARREMAPS